MRARFTGEHVLGKSRCAPLSFGSSTKNLGNSVLAHAIHAEVFRLHFIPKTELPGNNSSLS